MAERFVVVPWGPRALIVPPTDERASDGVDQLVDELFGPDVDEKPGLFDLALLTGGTALFLWSLVTGASAALKVVGGTAVVLGCAIPIRTAWRALQRRRVRHRHEAVMTLGLPLVADHAATAELISAYARLLEAGTLPNVGAFAEEALTAAHRAVVEVATLLDGAAPDGTAEEEYVAQRATAVERLALALEHHHRARAATEAGDAAAAEEAERRLGRDARLQAVEEIDGRIGPVSLERMTYLAEALEEGPQ